MSEPRELIIKVAEAAWLSPLSRFSTGKPRRIDYFIEQSCDWPLGNYPMVEKSAYDLLKVKCDTLEAELRLTQTMYKVMCVEINALTAQCEAYEQALEAIVLQFEDMTDAVDIRENWHQKARTALAKYKQK